jgi:hypothetical protein
MRSSTLADCADAGHVNRALEGHRRRDQCHHTPAGFGEKRVATFITSFSVADQMLPSFDAPCSLSAVSGT